MSATETQETDVALADQLQPKLDHRLAFGWPQAIACFWFALFFMYLNYIPLFHSDVWGHVLYGQWIIENGALPAEDPFLPIAEGMPVVDNAWLGQVLLGGAERLAGPAMLSNLFALVVLCSYLLQTRTFYLMSGRLSLALGGMAFSFFMGYSRHAIIRPEIFGFFCFSLLLWVIVRLPPWRQRSVAFAGREEASVPVWLWIAMPVLFMLWANLHGSFAVGLVVLGLHAVARILEVAWTRRSLAAVCGDRQVQTWILLTELAVVATLVNPYGLDLLIATARFGTEENLRDIMEWYPLKLLDLEGIQFAIGIVVLIALLRHSRARMYSVDVLLLLVMTVSVAQAIRMIGWFAPILTFTLLPHATEIVKRLWPRREENESVAEGSASTPRPRFTLTLVSLLAIWCAFALSPISQMVLGGKPRSDEQLYSRFTPLALSEFLREQPPDSLVFAPQWWGDWLVWSTGGEVDVFMTTNVHLIPRVAWRDYMRIAEGHSEWEEALERHNIQWMVVHKELQDRLARLARRSRYWSVVYEDDESILLRRVGSM